MYSLSARRVSGHESVRAGLVGGESTRDEFSAARDDAGRIAGATQKTAAVRYPTQNSVVIDAQSATGGLVVLHDTWSRGWTARVDGKPAPILPVNLISRGVMVGPGRHRIDMEYEPYGFRTGLSISAAGLIALLIAASSVSRRIAIRTS